ncbi:hypothetical protein F4808DRAFT_304170 [Astrocystis sublimbata]|nr:hypothetical protein F4808DRAFT_304170 [Astrocystis sublimbata]
MLFVKRNETSRSSYAASISALHPPRFQSICCQWLCLDTIPTYLVRGLFCIQSSLEVWVARVVPAWHREACRHLCCQTRWMFYACSMPLSPVGVNLPTLRLRGCQLVAAPTQVGLTGWTGCMSGKDNYSYSLRSWRGWHLTNGSTHLRSQN